MGRGRADEDDGLARADRAVPVDDPDREERPARGGVLRDLRDGQKISYEIERDRRSGKESAGQLKTV